MSDAPATTAAAPSAPTLPDDAVECPRRGAHDARGTMAPETGRALRRAWGVFHRRYGARGVPARPADAGQVAGSCPRAIVCRTGRDWTGRPLPRLRAAAAAEPARPAP